MPRLPLSTRLRAGFAAHAADVAVRLGWDIGLAGWFVIGYGAVRFALWVARELARPPSAELGSS